MECRWPRDLRCLGGRKGTKTSGEDAPIKVKDLSKVYDSSRGGEIRAIDSISFEVRRGEFVSIVGRSGCGKSTLLKIISGFISPTSGSVQVLGRNVDGPVLGIGQVFQRPTLMPWRTALDNVLLPIELLRLDRRELGDRATRLFDMVKLRGFENFLPQELSLGMRHRVSLARALVHDPEILVMDEPFGSLDELTREEISGELLGIIESLKKTVIFVTHSVPEAVMLGDRVLVLSSRPSRILDDVQVDIPRPRTSSVRSDPKLIAYCERIRALLGFAESSDKKSRA